MDEAIILLLLFLLLAAILCGVVLPIVALVQIRNLKYQVLTRIQRLEAALYNQPPPSPQGPYRAPVPPPPREAPPTPMQAPPPQPPPVEERPSQPPPPPHAPPRPPSPPAQPPAFAPQFPPPPPPVSTGQAERLETVIGKRLIGWVAMVLILFAVAFFLKYAFESRWIGEVGRVALGITGGIALTVAGLRYHKQGWRVFSQVLTAGGIMLMYLSVYAAFGFYDLIGQKTAFAFLVILVIEAGGLALLYRAPLMAIMALLGGFLAPILLRSDRDQYQSLFSYIAALDAGALALLKHWPGIASLAFASTHGLFWLWYAENYHPEKLAAVMAFQTAVFILFLAAHLVTHVARQKPAHPEDLALLFLNPFAFFGTSHLLLNENYHDWMGAFAIALALLYAGLARAMMARKVEARQLFLTIGTALTFVTLAVPIQLESNWVTIAWAVEALVILWVGAQVRSPLINAASAAVFALALFRLVFVDTPFIRRPDFTPLLNSYFLSSMIVITCVFAAGIIYRKSGEEEEQDATGRGIRMAIWLVGLGALWFVLTIETYTFFETRAGAERDFADARHQRWLGQMALSVLWSAYAAAMAAAGFIRKEAAVRWAALALFAVTIIKVVFVDMAELEQFYRIVAFFALGLLLLAVAWGYQKVFQPKESADEGVTR